MFVRFRVISWIVLSRAEASRETHSSLKRVISNARNYSVLTALLGSATPAEKPTQESKREPNSQGRTYRLQRMMFDIAL